MVRARVGGFLEGNSLPDTTGLIHIWTHKDCDHQYRTCTSSSQTRPAMRREGKHKVPVLTKKMFTTDPFKEKENQLPPMKWCRSYPPLWRTDLTFRSSWPTQNGQCSFVWFLCLWFGVLFCLSFLFVCFWEREKQGWERGREVKVGGRERVGVFWEDLGEGK